jgi:hypothetical protein
MDCCRAGGDSIYSQWVGDPHPRASHSAGQRYGIATGMEVHRIDSTDRRWEPFIEVSMSVHCRHDG